jgi:cytochrome oxidase Cu insertion factor (SCO1/SenC/PrrC family)
MPIRMLAVALLAAFMSASGPVLDAAPVEAQTRQQPGGEAHARAETRIPDIPVRDQNGRPLKFYTDLVKGKTVAINFIFTTCTTICPSLTATFRRVQEDLAARAPDVQLISISVDPITDTPERLRDFATRFHAGPGWTFVTGDKADIDSLLGGLGAAAANASDHTPTILVSNDVTGYRTRTYGLSSPAALVKVVTEAASRR